MVHITAMSLIIHCNPHIFKDTKRLAAEGRTGYGGGPHSSEDLHRAFQVLKFHLRHTSAAKEENSFYDSTDATALKEARYFTKADLEAAKTASGADPDGVETGAAHPMEELERAQDGLKEPDEEEIKEFEEDEAVFEKGVEMLDKITESVDASFNPDRAGVKQVRVPLSRAAQRDLCARLAKNVKVLHEDSWSELTPGEDAEVRTQTIV